MKLKSHPLTVKTHPMGFRQLDPLPSEADLKAHYEETYFQANEGQYSHEYTPAEKDWFHLDALVADHVFRERFPAIKGKPELLDVGCGEGFFSAKLAEKGWSVRACDFSSFGIKHFHPQLLPFFEQGNIYEILDREIRNERKYHLVNLGNVLEHVTDPVGLLGKLRKIIHPEGLIRIGVPNDFSELQEFLKAEGKIDSDYWLFPEHLSYFNFPNFRRLLESEEFRIERYLADHPIEHFLMHEGSNYKKNPAAGKQAHLARVKLDLFYSRDLPAYVRMLEAHASLGMGRDIIAFFR
jgi:SAM-dependent methyltransferase